MIAALPAQAGLSSIDASKAFAGRIALVTIAPATQEFAAPLQAAVAQALAIKPTAMFEVKASVPDTGDADAESRELGALLPLANGVALSVAGDGVAPSNVALTAGLGGSSPAILIYVK